MMKPLLAIASLASSVALAAPPDAVSDPAVFGPTAPGGAGAKLVEEVTPPAAPAAAAQPGAAVDGRLRGATEAPPPIVRAPELPPPPAEDPAAGAVEGRRLRRLRSQDRPRPETAPAPKGFSLFDATTLDDGQIGFLLAIGFPYITTRLQLSASDAVDWGVELNSSWGETAAVGTFVKYRLKHSPEGDFAFAVQLSADYTYFRDLESRSFWTRVAGIRDFSFSPGVVVSARSSSGSAYFIDVGTQVTLDIDPLDTGPLSRSQSPSLGMNFPMRLGAEWNLSKHANFYGITGVDLLLRKKDNRAAFFIAIGIAFMG